MKVSRTGVGVSDSVRLYPGLWCVQFEYNGSTVKLQRKGQEQADTEYKDVPLPDDTTSTTDHAPFIVHGGGDYRFEITVSGGSEVSAHFEKASE